MFDKLLFHNDFYHCSVASATVACCSNGHTDCARAAHGDEFQIFSHAVCSLVHGVRNGRSIGCHARHGDVLHFPVCPSAVEVEREAIPITDSSTSEVNHPTLWEDICCGTSWQE